MCRRARGGPLGTLHRLGADREARSHEVVMERGWACTASFEGLRWITLAARRLVVTRGFSVLGSRRLPGRAGILALTWPWSPCQPPYRLPQPALRRRIAKAIFTTQLGDHPRDCHLAKAKPPQGTEHLDLYV